ncbi:MAG: thrombospondin type 3 repeat-containing protein [Prosthecobacter sp.]|uniref:thrombospondin type 3 repeat-containing protein n=1 Tax=Prosthecobacter sp. TaxID=1965333 RepID=UPI0038FE1CDC
MKTIFPATQHTLKRPDAQQRCSDLSALLSFCGKLVARLIFFIAAATHAAAPSYENERELTAAGDFNGDGNADVLIVDKVTGLYRIGYGTGLMTGPSFASSRATGVTDATSIAVGKLFGTAADSFAITAPAQNRVQILAPSTASYVEPKTVLSVGLGPETLCAMDITTGGGNTPEDDLAAIITGHPTLANAMSELRSNAGSWSIIDVGDCPSFQTVRGNPLHTAVGGAILFGYLRDAGATNDFVAVNPTGVGFTTELSLPGLVDNVGFTAVPFQSPNMDLVFYVPGVSAVQVRRIVTSGPGWVFSAPFTHTFGAPVAQIVQVADPAGAKMLVRFSSGMLAIYGYTSGVGFSAPVTLSPTGGSGVISGVVPANGSSQFQVLYAAAPGQPSTTAISFANNGSGWTQTAITTLPAVNAYASYANVLLLSDMPFRADNVSQLHSYKAGDWSDSVSIGGGPFNVLAQIASFVRSAQGLGVPSAQNVGTAASATPGTAVNQQHLQFSIVNFDSTLGSRVEDVSISPAAGSFSTGIELSFIGYSGGTTVYYRIGSAGSFTAYNSAAPPWVFTDGSVYYYADKPGTGPTLTKSAAYTFTTPPALQDRDGDGVPDFVEVNKGLDPDGGSDSDADGFSDADEISAGTNPNNATSKPATDAPSLSTLLVDVSVRRQSATGLTTGRAANDTVITITDPLGNNLGSGSIGTGGAAVLFGRITVLNATGDKGYLIARTPDNFSNNPSMTTYPGRAMAGIVPVSEEDGWSFGSTQGALVTTGTAWSFGSTNWHNTSTNWSPTGANAGYDDHWSSTQQSFTFPIDGAGAAAPNWLAQNLAAANRGGQPYAQVTLTSETTLAALMLREMVRDLFAARGVIVTGDETTVDQNPHALRTRSSTTPTASIVRMSALVSYLDAALSHTDSTALRQVARDVYARHEALADAALGSMTAPLTALYEFVTTGNLPAEYLSGSTFTSGDYATAKARCAAVLAGYPTRSSATYTLVTRATASPAGLTLVQDSGGTPYVLVDADHDAIRLPSSVSLAAGTSMTVSAYFDLPAIASYAVLEVISLTIDALPSTIDADNDGDLLADSWERRHFGTLAYGMYDRLDASAYTLVEEYFRSTDPRSALSSPAVPPTNLEFSKFDLSLASGTPTLRVDWPAAYTSYINVNFEASDDLLSWGAPPELSATLADADTFAKTIALDRSRRFFRPLASLKR